MTDHDEDLLIRAKAAYQDAITDPAAFRRRARGLVGEARRSRDPEALCLALRASALAERYALQHRRAIELLNEAARIARQHKLEHLLGETLLTRGVVQHALGRLSAARRDFDAAEQLLPADATAELTSQRATLLANLGDLASAADQYSHLLKDPDLTAETRLKAAANFGILQAHRGRFTEALALLDVASHAAAQVSPLYVALVTENQAWVSVQAGFLADGVSRFDTARTMLDELGVPPSELLMEYSAALTQLRLLPEALENAHEAVEILESHGVELMAAEARLNVAWLSLLANRPDDAAAAAEAARTSFRRQSRAWGVAWATSVELEARLSRGAIQPRDATRGRQAAQALERSKMLTYAVNAYLAAGRAAAASSQRAAAIRCWTRSHELSSGLPVLVRLVGTLSAALAAQLRGRPDRVRSLTHSGLHDLAKHRAALPSTELRALASGHGEELGRLGLASRVDRQPAARVLAWMERTRAASLSVVDQQPNHDMGDDLGELRSVYAELVTARQETGAEPPGLRARQRRIEQRIRKATWGGHESAKQATAVVPVPELRRALEGRTLVEFDVLDGELIAAVLDVRRTRVVRLGPFGDMRTEAERALFYLRYLAKPQAPAIAVEAMHSNARATIDRLARMLIEPLGVAPDTELVIVPAKGMHSLPWAALHDAPVALAPSGATWVRSRELPAPGPGHVALVAGPDLPGAKSEIDQLATLYRDPVVVEPPESTMSTVAKVLDDAVLAHLACHCYVRADNPAFSRLLLSDGYLTVHELDRRAHVPYRVVLAACEAGNDALYQGNEMFGFISTLMSKGAAGVLASSIAVPDHDIVALMTALHRAIVDGQTLTRALHTARAEIDTSDPKQFLAWCAFNAFGAA